MPAMHYTFLMLVDLNSAAALRMRRIGEALLKRGVRVTYILPDTAGSRNPGDLPSGASALFVRRSNGVGVIWRYRRALWKAAPDYVEVLNPHPKTLAALAGLRRVRVVALWDEPPLMHSIRGLARLAARVMNRWLLSRAWLKVVAARHLQMDFSRRWGADTVYLPHVTYLGGGVPDGPSPFDRPTFVYMGTLVSYWDHDLLFEAARMLKSRGRKPAICFVGDGPDRPRWEAFIQEHGLTNVRLAGFLDEGMMWHHLRNAHALLFPMRPTPLNASRCSSKLFAYAQAQRPIIANRVGEAPEILGELAQYIDPTAEAFADAIDKLDAPRPADVAYDLSHLSADVRADQLLQAIRQREVGVPVAT